MTTAERSTSASTRGMVARHSIQTHRRGLRPRACGYDPWFGWDRFRLVLANVVGFHQDEEGVWVVELSCGHRQHVRHNPPWQMREWVTTEAGRKGKLGAAIDCPYCNMAAVPDGVTPYKRTATFTEETVPASLLHEHRTKPGTWAHIVVEEGKLAYTCDRGTFVLNPSVQGVVEPQVPHHVRLMGAVRFHVVFMRATS